MSVRQAARYAQDMGHGALDMGHGVRSAGVFLLLDTCGERASAALVQANGVVRAQGVLGARAASTDLLQAIRSALETGGVRLSELDGIGVVNGPGSFTGVRVGLAVAKGLCEAAQLPMAAVSRLEVLAEAGPAGAVCALSAGRDQVYLRSLRGGAAGERLVRDEDVPELRQEALLVVDSAELAARLAGGGAVQLINLTAPHALGPVLRRMAEGGSDVGLTDANYLRDEAAIYLKTGLPTARVASS